VDTSRQTIDVPLTDQRDEKAATSVLTQAICRHRVRETLTGDGSKGHAAAITAITRRTVQ
jgi:transposase-like protein